MTQTIKKSRRKKTYETKSIKNNEKFKWSTQRTSYLQSKVYGVKYEELENKSKKESKINRLLLRIRE